MKPTSSDMERAREIFNIMNCIGMGYTERQANADVYLIAQAIADEREACLSVVEAYKVDEVMTIQIETVSDIMEFFNQHVEKIATEIRKRVSK
jgi:alpha/beta superfamily hydrolase